MGVFAVIAAIARFGSASLLVLLGILIVVALIVGFNAVLWGWLIMLCLGAAGLTQFGFGVCFLMGIAATLVIG